MSRIAILIILNFLVAGCGGGSSAGPSNPSPPVQPIQVDPLTLPPVFQPLTLSQRDTIKQKYQIQMRFNNQPALQMIKADEAYVNLESARGNGASNPAQTPTLRPGEGIKIGVIDSGIKRSHPMFERISVQSYFTGSNTDVSHGTAVTSIMASNPQTSGLSSRHQFGGIAWGANFKMYAIRLGSGGGIYVPVTANEIGTYDAGAGSTLGRFRQAFNDGIDFLNLSIGLSGLIENYSEAELRRHISPRINLFTQAGKIDKTILVYAAGNDHGAECNSGTPNCRYNVSDDVWEIVASSPLVTSGLMVRIPELRSHMVAVVSVDAKTDVAKGTLKGRISEFSNRCGIAKQWCIAAPGQNISVAFTNNFGVDGRGIGKGTSYAAPFVTGGLAVMKHIFRGQLSNTALLQRLYATANKSGIYADSDIYGQGLMDLGAATSPQGSQTLSLGSTVDEGGVRLTGSRLNLGMAFGDGLHTGLMNHQIVAFDRLGAPFWYTLSNFVQHQRHSRPLSERLFRWNRSLQTRLGDDHRLSFSTDAAGAPSGDRPSTGKFQFGILQNQSTVSTGLLSLAENAVSLTYAGSNRFSVSAYTTASTRASQPMTGLMLSWRAQKLPVILRFASLGETASMLGSEASGAFGHVTSHSLAASAVTEFDWTGWRLRAEVEIGRSAPQANDGVIIGASEVWTSGFAVQGSRQLDRNNKITVGIAQPMRAEKGTLAMSMPVGRTPSGRVVRTPLNMALSPTGRQLDLSVSWQHQASAAEGFMLEGVYRRHPGHSVHSSSELEWTAGWGRRF